MYKYIIFFLVRAFYVQRSYRFLTVNFLQNNFLGKNFAHCSKNVNVLLFSVGWVFLILAPINNIKDIRQKIVARNGKEKNLNDFLSHNALCLATIL